MLVSDKTIDTHKRLIEMRAEYAAKKYLGPYGTYDESNPFSKILRGEAETELVDETPYAITIKNANQRTDTYNLVLPVYPANDYIDLLLHAPEDYQIGYMQAVAKAVRDIHPHYHSRVNELNGSAARVLYNVGPYSQNTVAHCHAHVTGDENPLQAGYLLIPEADFNHYDESVQKDVRSGRPLGAMVEKPILRWFENEFTQGDIDSEKIGYFEDGHILGQKNTLSYMKEYSKEEMSRNVRRLAFFLTAFNQMHMCLQNGEGHWGGRIVIDTDINANSSIEAISGIRLKKLPQTPLTVAQQKQYHDNLVASALQNSR